jgi:hypothetical protein
MHAAEHASAARHSRAATSFRLTSPYATIWELDEGSCRDALTGSAHEVKSRERRRQRHEETTMPEHLLPDECTPQELAGGRS